MATQHIFRLLVAAPVARHAAFNARIAATIDSPPAGPWLSGNLSATGLAPATWGWCSAALTVSDLQSLVGWMYTQAGGTPPSGATWNGWSRAQKKAWVQDTALPLIRDQFNVRIRIAENDGDWISDYSPAELLSDAGMQVIAPA